jgi:hypothetical protein
MGFTVLASYRVAFSSGKTHTISRCRCDCGNLFSARADRLKNGNTRSCGCLRNAVLKAASERKKGSRKAEVKPSNPRSPLYYTFLSWMNMRLRCENPNATQFKDYGGRGITVCARWADFDAFLADMGPRPEGLTLDREETDGNYEPGNCRWASRKEQQANRRPETKPRGPRSAETRAKISASVKKTLAGAKKPPGNPQAA